MGACEIDDSQYPGESARGPCVAKKKRTTIFYWRVPQPWRFSKAGDLPSSPPAAPSRASITQFSEANLAPFRKKRDKGNGRAPSRTVADLKRPMRGTGHLP